MAKAGRYQHWATKRLARQLHRGDRVFFWASTPILRIVALGHVTNEFLRKDRAGYSHFELRYLTSLLNWQPDIALLRSQRELTNASFLKAGPATAIFPLSVEQGVFLFRLLTESNPELGHIWPDISGAVRLMDIEEHAEEGEARWIQHFVRERNPKLRQTKIFAVLRRTGKLVCEACGLDFTAKYGPKGREICEVHHLKPLARYTKSERTTLADLALLCPNCHRFLHRFDPLLSIRRLRQILKRQTHEN